MGAEEGTLALFERGGIAWLREEALAAIQGAVFVDLPAPSPELEAQIRASAPTLAERFQAEFLALKACSPLSNPMNAYAAVIKPDLSGAAAYMTNMAGLSMHMGHVRYDLLAGTYTASTESQRSQVH